MADSNTHRICNRMPQLARTIAIVGPDGSGKTTQAELLVKRLQVAGYNAQYVHALYNISDNLPFANRLRRQFGPRQTRTQNLETYGPFYFVQRALFGLFGFWFALLTIGIVSVDLRNRNRIVVLDRYYHQFFYDIYGSSSITFSQFLPQPWRMIYLDADLPTIQMRMGIVDQAVDELYYATVIDLYDDCATDGWLSFSAELPIETLHEQIFETIRNDLNRDQLTSSTP